jgi:ApbE superfamily uncharacterized protein (UPF0280 family)
MVAAVSKFDGFITPMAAVAGAVADEVLSAIPKTDDILRIIVNNGGDIALYLAPGQKCDIGLHIETHALNRLGKLSISSSSSVRGVATSGWRGRSFSLGIADSVTTTASDCASADAAATVVAGAVDLPGNDLVTRRPARELSPDSDLGLLPVTVGVAPISLHETKYALALGSAKAEQLVSRQIIHSAALFLGEESAFVKSDLSPQQHRPLRVMQQTRPRLEPNDNLT